LWFRILLRQTQREETRYECGKIDSTRQVCRTSSGRQQISCWTQFLNQAAVQMGRLDTRLNLAAPSASVASWLVPVGTPCSHRHLCSSRPAAGQLGDGGDALLLEHHPHPHRTRRTITALVHVQELKRLQPAARSFLKGIALVVFSQRRDADPVLI
jgi:hypothetical protein